MSRFSRCVRAADHDIHCGESFMSLREVAMLYELYYMAKCRSTGLSFATTIRTYVASIFIGRDIILPHLLTLLSKRKARAPRPGDAGTGCQTARPFRTSLTLRALRSCSSFSRLLLRVRPREHMFTGTMQF